jgi:hypothetical protein
MPTQYFIIVPKNHGATYKIKVHQNGDGDGDRTEQNKGLAIKVFQQFLRTNKNWNFISKEDIVVKNVSLEIYNNNKSLVLDHKDGDYIGTHHESSTDTLLTTYTEPHTPVSPELSKQYIDDLKKLFDNCQISFKEATQL